MNVVRMIERLREIGKSQSDIARIGGVSQATISRLGNGKHSDTSSKTATRIENFLNQCELGKAI